MVVERGDGELRPLERSIWHSVAFTSTTMAEVGSKVLHLLPCAGARTLSLEIESQDGISSKPTRVFAPR